jgi:hypothetical protein
VRHGLLPIGGGALIVALLVGQIVEQTGPPYTWFPWVIVGWVVVAAAVAAWLAIARPHTLKVAGSVLATGAVDEAKNTDAFDPHEG